MQNNIGETINKLVNMGFCQKKFYKPTVWKYVTMVMDELCKTRVVAPCDFGRGKGKYSATMSIKSVCEIARSIPTVIDIAERYEKYISKQN